MLVWVIGVLLTSVGLMVGIDLLMNRLGIKPAAPEERSYGIRDVVLKINRWAAERLNDR